MYSLSSPLHQVRGVGAVLQKQFEAAGIKTVGDLLLQLPRRYEDRSQLATAKTAEAGQTVTLVGSFRNKKKYRRGRRTIVSAIFEDDSGSLTATWFNAPYIYSQLDPEKTFQVSGKINRSGNLVQPQLEQTSNTTIHTGRIVPLYTGTLGVKQGSLRRIIHHCCQQLALSDNLKKTLPQEIPELKTALSQAHFPTDLTLLEKAYERIELEELLELLFISQATSKIWQQQTSPSTIPPTDFEQHVVKLQQNLPFQLTTAQERCLADIKTDFSQNYPMNRLLIGDVGSGKTVVAGLAAAAILNQGKNVALIAPTKVLANQHLATIQRLLPELLIQLVTADTDSLTSSNQPQLFIGTHALINRLDSLTPGLVIYDEQHRFGTHQRMRGYQLDQQPHTLTLTATPIPRSLMLTIFSHLSLSTIDEMPAGRKITKTWVVPSKKHLASQHWIAEQLLTNSSQGLVVCPFIETSQTPGFEHIASIESTLTSWQHFIKTQKLALRLGVLHSKLSPQQQAAVIKQLYDKKIDLLLATPMIEVGVDLPAAQVISIYSAEQFGLASLHQLRGRVGRAGQQGYCLLHTSRSESNTSQAAAERLQFFSREHSGQNIAEYDLKNRGAGNLLGIEQHGFSGLRFGSLTNLARIRSAQEIFGQLPPDWQPQLQLHQQDVQTLSQSN